MPLQYESWGPYSPPSALRHRISPTGLPPPPILLNELLEADARRFTSQGRPTRRPAPLVVDGKVPPRAQSRIPRPVMRCGGNIISERRWKGIVGSSRRSEWKRITSHNGSQIPIPVSPPTSPPRYTQKFVPKPVVTSPPPAPPPAEIQLELEDTSIPPPAQRDYGNPCGTFSRATISAAVLDPSFIDNLSSHGRPTDDWAIRETPSSIRTLQSLFRPIADPAVRMEAGLDRGLLQPVSGVARFLKLQIRKIRDLQAGIDEKVASVRRPFEVRERLG
ncbi:hypothetical protein DFH27DRAFT_524340 [Peziza echinospora]|nr:hypothetical protein DFH27DRAFT_524340 [Peziza echinospora]